MSLSGSESQFHIVIRHPDTTTLAAEEEGACCFISTLLWGWGDTFMFQHSHHQGPATRVTRPVLVWHININTDHSPSSLQLAAAARSSAGFIDSLFLNQISLAHMSAGAAGAAQPGDWCWCNYESWLIATFIIAAEFSLILPAAGTYLAWHHSGCRRRDNLHTLNIYDLL